MRALPFLLCALWLRCAAQAPSAMEVQAQAHDTSPRLADMAARARPGAVGPRYTPPRLHVPPHAPRSGVAEGAPPMHGIATGPTVPPLPFVNTGGTPINQDGISASQGAPSDANAAVGADQVIQIVNVSFEVLDKATGAVLLGPVATNTVFAGFAGSPGADACRDTNNGDGIVQYDKQANRWIITQFAWSDAQAGPFYQCIAVSTSADARASWNRYVYEIRTATKGIAFNDYPKVGVWTDAYYFTYVLFTNTAGNFLGPQACGYDRAAMLAGAAAIGRCADFGTAYGVLLPSDLDGATLPPANSPAFLLALDFDQQGKGDHLYLWQISFSANTVSAPLKLPVAPFTIACPTTFGGPCIEQPAPGEKLDALGDRLMYRLPYRNFGNREVLLANHSVQQPGAAADGPAGVRWYEIRNPGGGAVVYQQGVHAPDANSRWMGSLAMDKMGNIAVEYSVAGHDLQPGIRYTGRLRTEPLGRLESEAVIINGAGVQINTYNRWGDYSSVALDPVNDCTFWTTQQYIAVTGSFNWRTRIADFAFRNCQ